MHMRYSLRIDMEPTMRGPEMRVRINLQETPQYAIDDKPINVARDVYLTPDVFFDEPLAEQFLKVGMRDLLRFIHNENEGFKREPKTAAQMEAEINRMLLDGGRRGK